MRISFLGGANEVGASGLIVESGGRRVLIDCGIRPSPKSYGGLAPDQLPDLSQIEGGSGRLDAILVTHAHTDHTGALELVVQHLPDVPVYATAPTLALTRILHQDARRIMQSRLEEEGELPLFDDLAVERLMDALTPAPFHVRLPIGGEMAVTFFPAGHIAGAAMIGIETAEGHLLISGDLSISSQRTVDGARPPAFRPDALVLESTYGGRLHANRAVQERRLVETIARVTGAGGKVLIPAFALGRAQEILLILGEYMRRGELAPVPVWADGMVRAVCQAYSAFVDFLPLPLQEQQARFFAPPIRPVQSAEQRNQILWEPGPAVIVASSGMLAGGPSLSYARQLAGKPEHAVLLTGYQDEESPGRRLQRLSERGGGTLRLGADKIDVQCQIATYALSAHADEAQLVSLTETLDPEQVFLVHGDPAARRSLESALARRGRIVHLPEAGQSITLQFERGRFVPADAAADPRRKHDELARRRRAAMQQLAHAAGKWVLLAAERATPVRCLAVAPDHLLVEIAPGLEQAVDPEAVLAVFETHPTPAELAPFLPQESPTAQPVMEPNQALATANRHFPPEARLRKSGYRLEQRVLTLTFDFPDAARERFANLVASLQAATGWMVEIVPETNQAALNALVRELLPPGTQILKGPAIHRDQKKVAVTIAPGAEAAAIAQIAGEFRAISGWDLELTLAGEAAGTPAVPAARAGARMEINAAYATIKSALQGSTLYRTSLKGDAITLAFISPQVGERYVQEIAALQEQTGWPLRIHPQPNQGAILEVARVLLSKAGLAVVKGPSIYPERAEVAATVAAALGDAEGLAEQFLQQTGYRLALSAASNPPQEAPARSQPQEAPTSPFLAQGEQGIQASAAVEIPLERIRLTPYQQTLHLNPAKLEKAVQQARTLGTVRPIQVRRVRDGYVLLDGLYRLRAAEALGWKRIAATVA